MSKLNLVIKIKTNTKKKKKQTTPIYVFLLVPPNDQQIVVSLFWFFLPALSLSSPVRLCHTHTGPCINSPFTFGFPVELFSIQEVAINIILPQINVFCDSGILS